MKKKRIFAVLTMIVLLIVCFSACSPNASIADPTEPSEVALPPYEPVFFMEATMSDSNNVSEEFKKAEEYGVTGNLRQEVFEDLENTTIKSPFTGSELKYMYSQCYYKNRESKEVGTYYSVRDLYMSANGSEQIFLLRGTDLICMYSNSRQTGSLIKEKVSMENIESLAIAFLTDLVGEDAVSGLECISARPAGAYSGSLTYIVTYTRRVKGYDTDETVTVYFDENGIYGFNGYNLCKYKGWEDKIDDRKIERATQALADKLASHKLVPTEAMMIPMITTDVDGKMYLKFFNVRLPNGTETVFVNVD